MVESKKEKAVKSILQVLAENEFTASESKAVLETTGWALESAPINNDVVNKITTSKDFKTLF